ncbi:MAG TPA: hypothetical protein VFL60_03140 [Gaiellaceae bacterium]|nr:hypothetical protein [Gaiellaceae bacterium]
MHRGVGAAVVAVLAALALSAAAAPAQASPGARFGIQDDAWLLYGPGSLEQRLTTLQGLGVSLVRVTLRWDAVAAKKPAQQRDPAAYDWGVYGDTLDALHAAGFTTLVTLYGSPRWANGGRSPARLPSAGFGNFAYAAAKRFPWVRLWTVWNEPNNGVFASPVSPSLYVRRLLNPGHAALHQANPRNQVAGGVTSPRKTPSGMAPLAFMQGMRAAHARLDAYAVNPYPLNKVETPTRATCSYCGYFTMAMLPRIRAYVTRYFGAKPLWLTEYGYQTNPPDRLLGVSQAKQAQYLGEAALRVWRQPGVTILVQFLVRDEPSIGGWQSGLFTVGGAPKLAVHAFALPLAQASRSGSRTTLWGMVRPGSGARGYVLQRRTAGGWRSLASGRTTRSGAFSRTVTAPPGTRVRIWAPALGYASPALAVS